jgi:hypothetical protein
MWPRELDFNMVGDTGTDVAGLLTREAESTYKQCGSISTQLL